MSVSKPLNFKLFKQDVKYKYFIINGLVKTLSH